MAARACTWPRPGWRRGHADVEGLAVGSTSFDGFHQQFLAAAGFEPDLVGQKIWSPQCPAVDFLKALHATGGAAPIVRLETVAIGAGSTLRGTVEDPEHRPLHLFQVSESGVVRDLSASLHADGPVQSFAVTVPRGREGGPYPQVLVVIAGPLGKPASATSPSAASFFPALIAAARDAPHMTGAAGKLFLLRD